MSSSSEFADCSRFLGQKSNFSQTCSLLSQYLKEKRTFGDLSLGMTCNFESNGMPKTFRQAATPITPSSTTTMNLFPVVETSVQFSGAPTREATTVSRNPKSLNLFPHQAGFGSAVSKEELPRQADFSVNKLETETAQMTIFYAGQVIVFNDFPADKAKEIMLLASKGSSSQNPNTFAPGNLVPSASNVVPNLHNNNLIQECAQRPPQPIVTDLPIKRKASLTRFLEKRKDRITARAPYQTSNSPAAPSKPSKPAGKQVMDQFGLSISAAI